MIWINTCIAVFVCVRGSLYALLTCINYSLILRNAWKAWTLAPITRVYITRMKRFKSAMRDVDNNNVLVRLWKEHVRLYKSGLKMYVNEPVTEQCWKSFLFWSKDIVTRDKTTRPLMWFKLTLTSYFYNESDALTTAPKRPVFNFNLISLYNVTQRIRA